MSVHSHTMSTNSEDKRFPYEFYELDPKLEEKLMQDFPAVRSGFFQVGPERLLYLKIYKNEANNIYNFKVRPNDVWLAGIPRSGTTLTQEMVWLISNNLDFEKASKSVIDVRFPFLDLDTLNETAVIEELKKNQPSWSEKQSCVLPYNKRVLQQLEEDPAKRFIKTHLPFSFLPPDLLKKGCKVIYVARNPLDVAVSLYHFSRLTRQVDYEGNFETLWGYFKNNLMYHTPYWKHIKEGWERRHEENLLFLFYEDIVADLKATIRRVANFLGVTLNEEQICQLENHLDFKQFKNNKSVNHNSDVEMNFFKEGENAFIRKGKVGGWRDYFNDEEAKEAEEWLKENQKAIGVEFKY